MEQAKEHRITKPRLSRLILAVLWAVTFILMCVAVYRGGGEPLGLSALRRAAERPPDPVEQFYHRSHAINQPPRAAAPTAASHGSWIWWKLVLLSAAVSVLTAGKKRFIFPNSEIMIHMARTTSQGDEDEIKKQRTEFLKIQQQYIDILSKCTGKSPEAVKEAKKEETWMNAEEGKTFGLVDHVIASLTDIDL